MFDFVIGIELGIVVGGGILVLIDVVIVVYNVSLMIVCVIWFVFVEVEVVWVIVVDDVFIDDIVDMVCCIGDVDFWVVVERLVVNVGLFGVCNWVF